MVMGQAADIYIYITLEAWAGPEGARSMRLPEFLEN
jgi:hypothetical protein